MPRRKQVRPKRMKYSEDGKEEEDKGEASEGGTDEEGDDEDEDEDTENEDKPLEKVCESSPHIKLQPSQMDREDDPRRRKVPSRDSPPEAQPLCQSELDPRAVPTKDRNEMTDTMTPGVIMAACDGICKATEPAVQPLTVSKIPQHGVIKRSKFSLPSKPSRPLYNEPSNAFDEPLDLSKPLDLSNKPKIKTEPDKTLNSDSNSRESNMSPSCISEPGESSSSLANLEKRFGGNSYLFEGLGSKLKPSKNPVYQAFGGNLFTTALYNTPPMITTDQIYRPERNYWSSLGGCISSPQVSIQAHSPGPSSTPISVTKTHTTESQYTAEPRIQKDHVGGKYTNFPCSCKKSFDTLYELTIHMERTGHCPTATRNGDHSEYPKLVRGQDMWLNQGSEQTRQILRCMQCGESYKSLPELTIHMMKTKHYTNIVGADSKKVHKCSSYCDKCEGDSPQNVFRCKVCQEGFTDMDALANHMVISGHHKKHIVKCTSSENLCPSISPPAKPKTYGTPSTSPKNHLGGSTVASLLEYKRQVDKEIEDDDGHSDIKPQIPKDNESVPEVSRIRCENCGDKIDTNRFVDHVRMCVKNKSKVLDALKAKLKPEEEDRMEWNRNPYNQTDNDFGDSEDSYSPPASPVVRRPQSRDQHPVKPPDFQPEVMSEKNNDRMRRSSRESPSSVPILHSTTEPSTPEAMGGSALKAMENFIERSFTSSASRPTFRSSKPCTECGFDQGRRHVAKYDYPLPDSTAPTLEASEGQKYLDPGFPLVISHKKPKEEVGDHIGPPQVKLEKTEKQDSPMNMNMNMNIDITKEPKREPSDVSPKLKSPKALHQKYLSQTTSIQHTTKGSALDSLQGLVYGQSFSTEHPLDSLQKLIHNTENGLPHRPNGSQSSILTGTTTIQQSGMPSTVILVNPIVTVVPNSNAPPAVQINVSHNSSPPTPSQHSPQEIDKGGLSEGEGGEGGDNRCQACNRSFASKGSYRYHLSRCHLSSVKKYGIKDAFNMSPYVYLPLDHSAKFNKYYEMANELANKGK